MNRLLKCSIPALTTAVLYGACAALPPSQLVDAREAYNTSANGLAAKLSPTELYDAKKVLDKANLEFSEHGDTLKVRDFAYIAGRKVELADVKARTEVDRLKIAEAEKQGIAVRDRQVKNGQIALAQSQNQLKSERLANDASTSALKAANTAEGQALAKSEADLDAETKARMAAESKLNAAMVDLAAIAAIKQEDRGLVITLSGSVLFASGKYALLETAKSKLDQVAEALKDQNADRKMVVEGHTDSRGSDATNQVLSLNRANTVREYLVGRGVDANRISAMGMGSSRPLLDNGNAENRANNRRVEIIIQPVQISQQ